MGGEMVGWCGGVGDGPRQEGGMMCGGRGPEDIMLW